MLITNARFVTTDRVTEPGWLRCDEGVVMDRGIGRLAGGLDLHGLLVTPGFVDIHVHGGATADFGDGTAAAVAAARLHHLRHGTTSLLAAVTTAPLADAGAALTCLSRAHRAGDIAGTFLEGPYLSDIRRGAHDPALLRLPDDDELRALLAAGDTSVRMVTLAPELDGAHRLIDTVVDAGAKAAVGHTDATYDEAREAFDRGATVATHLFNGMRPIHHREPGVITAALADQRVTCEIVADGAHIADSMVRFVFDVVGPDRVALVTDAIRASGAPDGRYLDGTMPVIVAGGVAMLTDGSSLAGSTLTMDAALRRAVFHAGVSLPDAVRASSTTPARAVGITGGALHLGDRADFVVLTDDLTVAAVAKGGAWVHHPTYQSPTAPSG